LEKGLTQQCSKALASEFKWHRKFRDAQNWVRFSRENFDNFHRWRQFAEISLDVLLSLNARAEGDGACYGAIYKVTNIL
jgi:hypothetical protein